MNDGGRIVNASDEDLGVLREAASALSAQFGRGVPRAALVAMAGPASRRWTVLAPAVAGEPVMAVVHPPRRASGFDSLTARELQVTELVAAGRTNQQIASALRITVGTVKDHVHHILAKTGLPSRAAVAGAWR